MRTGRKSWGRLGAWLLFLGAGVWAAHAAAEDRDLRFKHLSIDQGLSQNTVYTILQDRLGFLWFGTGDGLNRYDGYRFQVLRRNPTDANSLSHNHVRSLYEDRQGILWIGTRSGLNRYDRRSRTVTRYLHDADDPRSLAHDLVWAIHEDREGRLWVATGGGGVSRLDALPSDSTATARFTRLHHRPDDPHSLSDDRVRAIHEDRDGVLWFGTRNGLNRLGPNGRSFTRIRLDPPAGDLPDYNFIFTIHEDRRGALWLGTRLGLVRFEPADGALTHYRHDPAQPNRHSRDSVWDIYEDRQGTFWIATYGGGLLLFDPVAETFSRHRHDPNRSRSLSEDKAVVLFEDRSGAFWIGTSGGGLNKLSFATKAFGHYRRDPEAAGGLSDNMVMSIHEDREGMLWVGTWNGGLNRLDRATGAVKTYPADPDDPRRLAYHDVRALLEDRHGTLWVGTELGGLHRLDRSSRKRADAFVRYRHDPDDPGSLRDDDVWVLCEDRAGTLWVGTYGGGLSRYRPADDAFSHYLHDPADPGSLSSDIVRALHEDAEGNLWVGTSGGLNRLAPDRGGRFLRFRHRAEDPASLSSDEILSVHQDRAGTLWIGTHGGGLNQLLRDPSTDLAAATFRHFLEAEGLPSNVVYGILEDGEGGLWLSTNRGLARFDSQTSTFRNYDVTDGLQSNEFNSGAYHQNRRGELFFGGINGVNVFLPDQIQDNPFVPPVVLTSFKIFNKEVALGTDLATLSAVTLRPGDSVVSFGFAALSFTTPQKNRYAYKLSGFRDQWVALGTQRDVTFTNLDPGDYTLHVRGSNDDGVWNEEGLAITVTVEPPFWRTWWFMTLAVLAAAATLWGSHRLRTRRMRRHNLALEAEVAERRRAEQALEHLIGELETKNTELEARNAEMERFVYTVSHDLKTPLVTIKGFLGLLRQDAAGGNVERLERDASRIAAAADTMAHLLEELLELSRIGRLMNPPEEVDLSELAAEAAALAARGIAGRGVAVDIAPAMPVVFGDRVRLLEVYHNLIDNAVKFMGDQAAPRIEIGARQRDGEVLCFVRDNGIGIDPRYHDNVFGLFNRLDQSVAGTGVGLALVKRIVEVHGGRIWVESEGAGRGSSFCFVLQAHG